MRDWISAPVRSVVTRFKKRIAAMSNVDIAIDRNNLKASAVSLTEDVAIRLEWSSLDVMPADRQIKRVLKHGIDAQIRRIQHDTGSPE